MAPWAAAAGGLRLLVRVTPRGGRDAVEGCGTLDDGREILKVRVRALPSEGEANAAVCALVAGWLGLPRRDVTLVAGGRGRLKTLAIAGAPEILIARLTQLLETAA